MKKYHKIITVLLFLTINYASFFLGGHDFYMASDGESSFMYPHFYNTHDALQHERAYCNAWIELAHYYLYDNNPSFCSECNKYNSYEAERNNYWLDVVSESDYYDRINTLNEGDWEDFYSYWINNNELKAYTSSITGL